MCARHITVETYFNVKTLERIPWELTRRGKQELDFLKKRKNAPPVSLCVQAFILKGSTRGVRSLLGEKRMIFVSSVEESVVGIIYIGDR